MSVKSIAKVWTFKSSSSEKTYQTLLYSDSTTSCDCPGWTRRCDGDGKRTCRHVRYVELGTADSEAANFHSYDPENGAVKTSMHRYPPDRKKSAIRNQQSPMLSYGNRKLCL